MNTKTLFYIFLSLVFFTFCTMVLGGWVRNEGAGLSCPDWPLCHGQIIPPMEYRIMLEYGHRLAATLVSILLLIAGFFIFLKDQKQLKKLFGVALLLLFVQIFMGYLTVAKLLQWEIVALHLGVAVLFYSILLWMTLRTFFIAYPPNSPSVSIPPTFFYGARIALVLLFLQILLGGSVSSNYGGLACPDFPTCHGEWFPGFSGLVGLQFTHRLMALLFTLATIYFLWQWRKLPKTKLSLRCFVPWSIATLLFTQWSLGVGMIVAGVKSSTSTIPAWISVAHLGIAILLLSLILISHYVFYRKSLH